MHFVFLPVVYKEVCTQQTHRHLFHHSLRLGQPRGPLAGRANLSQGGVVIKTAKNGLRWKSRVQGSRWSRPAAARYAKSAFEVPRSQRSAPDRLD